MPVTPGYRGLGLATPEHPAQRRDQRGRGAAVITGSPSAEFGNAQSGVVSLVTRTGGTRYSRGAQLRDRRAVRGESRPRLNRLEASLGGPLARNLTFFAAGVLEGQRSARPGSAASRRQSSSPPAWTPWWRCPSIPPSLRIRPTCRCTAWPCIGEARPVPPKRQRRHPGQLRLALPGDPDPRQPTLYL